MPSDDVKELPPAPERKLLPPHHRGPWTIAIWLLAGIALAFMIGYIPSHRREKAAEEAAQRQKDALPTVQAMAVERSPAVSQMVLPSNVTPITEASIFARASGYVKRRYVDIGDRVKAGQVLADIESPEVDQQVAQARAAVAQAEQQVGQTQAALEDARARLELARVTYERYRVLLTQNSVSRQDTDQQYQAWQSAQAAVTAAAANVAASQANVRAAEANLRRTIDIQSYEHVRAPFAGIVTARNFDVGALIGSSGSSLGVTGGASGSPSGGQDSGQSASSSSSSTTIAASPTAGPQGGELFRVAQVDRLRVLVTVPQESAPSIRVGTPAKVLVTQFGGRTFEGQVTRAANSLDPASRTMLTEIQVANPDGALLPGMYAQAEFNTARTTPPLLVPGDAVITRANGTQVAVLVDPRPEDRQRLPAAERDNAKRVHLQTVQLGRDYGMSIEITGGLQGWEHIVVNPEDEVVEGALVSPHAASRAQGTQSGRGRENDRAPAGIVSPSEAAPMQGPPARGGGRGDQPSSGQRGERGR